MSNDILTIEQEIYEITVEQAGADGVAGSDGKSAYEIAVDNGFSGSETDWLTALRGTDGSDGLSAYEIAVQGGFVGTEAQWLASLRGADGNDGNDGLNASVSIGTTTTLPAGQNASVSNSGTSQNSILNFSIPRGADGQNGQAATISIGITTTGAAGTQAQVSNSGTPQNAILNFTIPKGADGTSSSGSGLDFRKHYIGYVNYVTGGLGGLGQSYTTFNCNLNNSNVTSYQQYVVTSGYETWSLRPKLAYQLSSSTATGYILSNSILNFALQDEGFECTQIFSFAPNAQVPTGNNFAIGLGNPNTTSQANLDSIFTTSSALAFIGLAHSTTESSFSLMMNIYSDSANPIKIPLSSFTGNLVSNDYNAKQMGIWWELSFKYVKGNNYVTVTFRNLMNGNSGYYNFPFSSMKTIDRTALTLKQFMWCGTTSTITYLCTGQIYFDKYINF